MPESEEDEDSGPPELIPCPRVRQYPGSLALLKEVVEGKRSSFQAPWRCVWEDGHCYENSHVTWVAVGEAVQEANGRTWQKPVRVMVSIPAESSRRVDV